MCISVRQIIVNMHPNPLIFIALLLFAQILNENMGLSAVLNGKTLTFTVVDCSLFTGSNIKKWCRSNEVAEYFLQPQCVFRACKKIVKN